jgi:hypothetical protein
MKKTGWIPMTVDPVHRGFYEVKHHGMKFWSGTKWFYEDFPGQLVPSGNCMKNRQRLVWRGLVEPAK